MNEKEELRIRIDDLIMTIAHIKCVKPKLYYKVLPHLQEIKKILKPFWSR